MGNKIFYKGYGVGETTQVSIMPTATADNSGAIVQYVGATNVNYTNGYFYKCVSDGAATPAYSWEKIQVSDGGDTIQNAVLKSDVADSVTNGNMNPVTSNAVYDMLMNVTTLAPTKTANVGTVYEAEFLRMGRLVFVNLNLIASSGILYTGLPKPTSRQTFTINGFHEQDKALRLIVNTDGSIETDNSSAITNQNIGGHIVYITSEN